MDQPDSHEKTEDATPYKLEEARKKGSVHKSQDAIGVLILGALCLYLIALGNQTAAALLNVFREMFLLANGLAPDRALHYLGSRWMPEIMGALAPLIALVMLVAILGSVVQTRGVFSFFPLKLDLSKLNPVKGIKKLFSKKLLFEIFKSLMKLCLLAVILYWLVFTNFLDYLYFFRLSESQYLPNAISLAVKYMIYLMIGLAFLALLDFMFGKREFLKQMKMTRKELKDEIKRREGDPLIKSKRKALEKELRKKGNSLAAVPGADVVITNPTHFAVVLKYDRNTMVAPRLVGKGADDLAMTLRYEAVRFGVPVIESPTLARDLFRFVPIDGYIREKDYVDVAKVLRLAYQKKKDRAVGARA